MPCFCCVQADQTIQEVNAAIADLEKKRSQVCCHSDALVSFPDPGPVFDHLQFASTGGGRKLLSSVVPSLVPRLLPSFLSTIAREEPGSKAMFRAIVLSHSNLSCIVSVSESLIE